MSERQGWVQALLNVLEALSIFSSTCKKCVSSTINRHILIVCSHCLAQSGQTQFTWQASTKS